MVFSKDIFSAIYMEYIKGFVPIRYRGYCLCISPHLITSESIPTLSPTSVIENGDVGNCIRKFIYAQDYKPDTVVDGQEFAQQSLGGIQMTRNANLRVPLKYFGICLSAFCNRT
jgi:hypothetical protein